MGGDRGHDRWSGGDRDRWLMQNRWLVARSRQVKECRGGVEGRDHVQGVLQVQGRSNLHRGAEVRVYEDRFRVDRRKLELMMMGSGGKTEILEKIWSI